MAFQELNIKKMKQDFVDAFFEDLVSDIEDCTDYKDGAEIIDDYFGDAGKDPGEDAQFDKDYEETEDILNEFLANFKADVISRIKKLKIEY